MRVDRLGVCEGWGSGNFSQGGGVEGDEGAFMSDVPDLM